MDSNELQKKQIKPVASTVLESNMQKYATCAIEPDKSPWFT